MPPCLLKHKRAANIDILPRKPPPGANYFRANILYGPIFFDTVEYLNDFVLNVLTPLHDPQHNPPQTRPQSLPRRRNL